MKQAPAPATLLPTEIAGLPGNTQHPLHKMLRVDHAGEYGAQRIYAGQLAVLGNSAVGAELRHMAAQEDEHLAAFEQLAPQHGVRPTALHPLWHVGGFALGWVTAKISPQAAMACTVAVEEVIVDHYASQHRQLLINKNSLAKVVKKFMDDEAAHRQIGLDLGAESAVAYKLLYYCIKGITRSAIKLSESI